MNNSPTQRRVRPGLALERKAQAGQAAEVSQSKRYYGASSSSSSKSVLEKVQNQFTKVVLMLDLILCLNMTLRSLGNVWGRFWKPPGLIFRSFFERAKLAMRKALDVQKPLFFLGFSRFLHTARLVHKAKNDTKSMQEPVEQRFPQRSY